MSILDKLFGSGATSTAPAPATPSAPATPGNLSANPTQATPENPNVPVTPTEPASPMDQFKELWQPAQSDPEANQPLIDVDPKQLMEAARKTDFTKHVSPELLKSVAAGGEEGVTAMMQMMNQVVQGAYAQSAFASSKLVEQAVAKAREQFNADIPAHVKKLQVSDTLRTENPVFNHPAASPILGAVESQLTMKFPQASATEITNMAKQYLDSFANAITAPAQAEAAAKAAKTAQSKDTDWSNFLS